MSGAVSSDHPSVLDLSSSYGSGDSVSVEEGRTGTDVAGSRSRQIVRLYMDENEW